MVVERDGEARRFSGPGEVSLYYRYDDFTDPWKERPTAILQHGFPRNSRLWYAWVPGLSRHLRIVRPDFRGLGLSRVPLATYQNSPEVLRLDALALMDHLNLDKAIWIGEATGGVLGAYLAATVPERFHCVILMSAPLRVADVAFASDPEYQKKLRSGEAVVGPEMLDALRSKGMRAWAQISARSRPRFWGAPPEQAQWYVEQLSKSDPLLAAEFYRPMPQVDVLPLASKIAVPTLFINGTHNPMLPPNQLAEFSKNPNVRVVTVEGPGIDIQYARPEACVAAVKDFLKELDLLDKDLP